MNLNYKHMHNPVLSSFFHAFFFNSTVFLQEIINSYRMLRKSALLSVFSTMIWNLMNEELSIYHNVFKSKLWSTGDKYDVCLNSHSFYAEKKCCNWLSASKNFHYVHYMEACEYLNIDQLFSIKTNNNHKKKCSS